MSELELMLINKLDIITPLFTISVVCFIISLIFNKQQHKSIEQKTEEISKLKSTIKNQNVQIIVLSKDVC